MQAIDEQATRPHGCFQRPVHPFGHDYLCIGHTDDFTLLPCDQVLSLAFPGSVHDTIRTAQLAPPTGFDVGHDVHRCHGAGCQVPFRPTALHGGTGGADANLGPRCLASSLQTLSCLAFPAPIYLILPQGTKAYSIGPPCFLPSPMDLLVAADQVQMQS